MTCKKKLKNRDAEDNKHFPSGALIGVIKSKPIIIYITDEDQDDATDNETPLALPRAQVTISGPTYGRATTAEGSGNRGNDDSDDYEDADDSSDHSSLSSGRGTISDDNESTDPLTHLTRSRKTVEVQTSQYSDAMLTMRCPQVLELELGVYRSIIRNTSVQPLGPWSGTIL